METIIFICDHCGARSTEEVAGLHRSHCALEIVLRGKRFLPATALRVTDESAGAVYQVSQSPELASAIGEDERWGTSLCDRCMKRFAGILGLKLETPEEYQARQDELARRTADAFGKWPGGTPAGQHGELITQFPTQPTTHPTNFGAYAAPASKSDKARKARKRKKSEP
jgi:hypothetical protein